ncbi:hypothetical protein, unlikely [Trypanosoma brucei brucei TREU927]|uniref:Uncharacterized protein n=1 Tax=Trypanosoma brucei brucei (strain 927/4 GUTat10.1) TaxID=185431 RepID=Q4GY92_TRYB2|nr:hypothetical protein, unlikely [Trypanosoma brucei brucei TREU927]CAJ16694.1 hypothetical protein, unlikely [Trypanosoma brucei brucei TREU927]
MGSEEGMEKHSMNVQVLIMVVEVFIWRVDELIEKLKKSVAQLSWESVITWHGE